MDRKFKAPDWEKLYQDEDVEGMPWFQSELDQDLAAALEELGIESGSVLDLGTGPGTQAVVLARRGFAVIATDVSETAVKKASERALKEGVEVDFIRDDILETALDREFDFIFDRGCFHTLEPDKRGLFAETVHRLLKPSGVLFLKCFSHLETSEEGPHRFSPDELRSVFERLFNIRSIKDTVFQGTMDHFPKALFAVMVKG